MKIIAVGTLKGGVGKTTTVFNIAGILANKGYKVLCMDMDPQGNLTSALGINRADKNLIGLEQVFTDNSNTTFNSLVINAPLEYLPTLDLLASTIYLHKAELSIAFATARESILKNFIEENYKDFIEYDYILIDTNPSLSYLNQNAFYIADKIIMPSTTDKADIEGYHLFCALWDTFRRHLKKEDNIAAFLITRFDKRNKIDKQFIDYIDSAEENQDVKEILLDTIIPLNVTVKESSVANNPLCLYNDSCAGGKAYIALVDELFKKGVL